MGQKRSTLQKEHSLFILAQAKQGEKKLYVLSFYMIIVRGCAMCWWEISNECSLCMRDLPHTYFCTCLYSNKRKQRWKQTWALPIWTTGSLSHFIIIITTITIVIIVIIIIIIIIIIIYSLLYL
jgi:hypothetical protein